MQIQSDITVHLIFGIHVRSSYQTRSYSSYASLYCKLSSFYMLFTLPWSSLSFYYYYYRRYYRSCVGLIIIISFAYSCWVKPCNGNLELGLFLQERSSDRLCISYIAINYIELKINKKNQQSIMWKYKFCSFLFCILSLGDWYNKSTNKDLLKCINLHVMYSIRW